jgi:hypothetical protein
MPKAVKYAQKISARPAKLAPNMVAAQLRDGTPGKPVETIGAVKYSSAPTNSPTWRNSAAYNPERKESFHKTILII